MHRFYLSPADCRGAELALTGREAHHALHVLRLRRSDRVVVLDGDGQIFDCELGTATGDRVTLQILKRHLQPPLPYQLTLAQAVPKGKLFEEIIEKATELGVARIVPLLTRRTIGKFDDYELEHKLAKWRLTAIEAIKQCGLPWLPRVEKPATVDSFTREQSELSLVASLSTEALHPRIYFERFASEHKRKPKAVSIAIGPEGDFTPEELSVLQAGGAQPITLGELVLRTDTASVCSLSFINYEMRAPA